MSLRHCQQLRLLFGRELLQLHLRWQFSSIHALEHGRNWILHPVDDSSLACQHLLLLLQHEQLLFLLELLLVHHVCLSLEEPL